MSIFSHWDEDNEEDDWEGTQLFRHWREDEEEEFRPYAPKDDE
jgi:hypothetical protein